MKEHIRITTSLYKENPNNSSDFVVKQILSSTTNLRVRYEIMAKNLSNFSQIDAATKYVLVPLVTFPEVFCGHSRSELQTMTKTAIFEFMDKREQAYNAWLKGMKDFFTVLLTETTVYKTYTGQAFDRLIAESTIIRAVWARIKDGGASFLNQLCIPYPELVFNVTLPAETTVCGKIKCTRYGSFDFKVGYNEHTKGLMVDNEFTIEQFVELLKENPWCIDEKASNIDEHGKLSVP